VNLNNGGLSMKDIIGYEGLYAVTSCGKVWSYKSKKFLKQRLDKDGYPRVTLHKNGKLKTYHVHKLVALAFVPNPNGYVEINHKSEIKTQNWVSNIEWCSHKYNVNYGTRTERARIKRSSGGKKIGGMTIKEISAKTGKPIQTIYWEIHQGWTDEQILAM
jgi:hypothetical protein